MWRGYTRMFRLKAVHSHIASRTISESAVRAAPRRDGSTRSGRTAESLRPTSGDARSVEVTAEWRYGPRWLCATEDDELEPVPRHRFVARHVRRDVNPIFWLSIKPAVSIQRGRRRSCCLSVHIALNTSCYNHVLASDEERENVENTGSSRGDLGTSVGRITAFFIRSVEPWFGIIQKIMRMDLYALEDVGLLCVI